MHGERQQVQSVASSLGSGGRKCWLLISLPSCLPALPPVPSIWSVGVQERRGKSHEGHEYQQFLLWRGPQGLRSSSPEILFPWKRELVIWDIFLPLMPTSQHNHVQIFQTPWERK